MTTGSGASTPLRPSGQYFVNPTPITGQPLCEVARSTHEDVDKALDAAHAAAISWNGTTPAYRANILNRIADRIEANLETLAFIETIDNGKPIRETTDADLPLAVDHFRYFAGCIRAQEGGLSQLDEDTVAYHFHEPLGVVAQIIPWNFPLLMATWKLAPALAAGNMRRAQAGGADPGIDHGADGAASPTSCPAAWSTWCRASVSKPESRWPRAREWPRSPSPVRPPPAG